MKHLLIDQINAYFLSLIRSCVSGEARQDQPCAVHGVAGHHDAGPAAHAHHARQPAVRPHLLLLSRTEYIHIHNQVYLQ